MQEPTVELPRRVVQEWLDLFREYEEVDISSKYLFRAGATLANAVEKAGLTAKGEGE